MDKIEDIDQRINNLRKQQETLKETVSGHGHNGNLKVSSANCVIQNLQKVKNCNIM